MYAITYYTLNVAAVTAVLPVRCKSWTTIKIIDWKKGSAPFGGL